MKKSIGLIVSVLQEKIKRFNHYIILVGTSEDKKKKAADTISFAYIVLLDSVTPLLCLALYLFSIWVSKLQVLSDMLWL